MPLLAVVLAWSKAPYSCGTAPDLPWEGTPASPLRRPIRGPGTSAAGLLRVLYSGWVGGVKKQLVRISYLSIF